jgi:hypothetical protein
MLSQKVQLVVWGIAALAMAGSGLGHGARAGNPPALQTQQNSLSDALALVYTYLQPGMSQETVMAIAGTPTRHLPLTASEEKWIWISPDRSELSVIFQQGKVISTSWQAAAQRSLQDTVAGRSLTVEAQETAEKIQQGMPRSEVETLLTQWEKQFEGKTGANETIVGWQYQEGSKVVITFRNDEVSAVSWSANNFLVPIRNPWRIHRPTP